MYFQVGVVRNPYKQVYVNGERKRMPAVTKIHIKSGFFQFYNHVLPMYNFKPNFKNLLIILTVFLLPIISNAQTSYSKFFAEASFGASIPVGKFANDDYGGKYLDQGDGLAKRGMGLNLSVGYHIKNSVAVMLILGGSQNKQDENAYDNYIKKTLGSTATTNIETNIWKLVKIMSGVSIETPLLKESKLQFRAKLLGGVCKTSIPGFKYAYSVPGNTIPIVGSITTAKTKFPWSFCYQVSTGLKYQLAKKVYLLADINYFGSNPVYKYSINPNFPQPGALVPAEKKIGLSAIQVMIGAGFSF